MKLIDGIRSVQDNWANHTFNDFEASYEAICGAFVRRESGPISPVGMEEELRDTRLKLILLRFASCDPVLTEAIFSMSSPNDWETLPDAIFSSRRALYCLRETNASMVTNGPSAPPKTYSFGPWFEPFRRHVEKMTYSRYGLGFRRMHVSIDSSAGGKANVEQVSTQTGEVTEIKMDIMSLVRRVQWLADHAKEFHYDQVILPSSIVAAFAKAWKGNKIEVVSGSTKLYNHEFAMGAEAFGYPIIDAMRCWHGGFTFTTDLDGKRIAMSEFFDWKMVDNKLRTVDLFNHAYPFVNHQSDDEIVMDGQFVVSISKNFEHIHGIDADAIGPDLTNEVGFWQVLHKSGCLYAYPKQAVLIIEDITGQKVEPIADPIGIGIRNKLYHIVDLDIAKNHGRIVPL